MCARAREVEDGEQAGAAGLAVVARHDGDRAVDGHALRAVHVERGAVSERLAQGVAGFQRAMLPLLAS